MKTKKPIEDIIVDRIVYNLEDINGIRDAWDEMEESTRKGIIRRWKKRVRKQLENAGLIEGKRNED